MDAQMGTVLVHGIREAYGRYAKKEHISIVKIVSHWLLYSFIMFHDMSWFYLLLRLHLENITMFATATASYGHLWPWSPYWWRLIYYPLVSRWSSPGGWTYLIDMPKSIQHQYIYIDWFVTSFEVWGSSISSLSWFDWSHCLFEQYIYI